MTAEVFIGSAPKPPVAGFRLLGLPLDSTVTRKTGARHGPESIRAESHHLETYSLALEKSLDSVEYFDMGDLSFSRVNMEVDLEKIFLTTNRIFERGFRGCFLGGEHLVSLPVIRAAGQVFSDLRVVHLDAHADLRDIHLGSAMNHATVMRRVASDVLGSTERLFQFGIRSGCREEIEWGRNNVSMYPGPDIEDNIRSAVDLFGDFPVYLSIDIDVIDPGSAPGTGTPEPGGNTPLEVLDSLRIMKEAGVDIVGFDIVEVAPELDCNGVTSALGAALVRECLLLWGGGNC
ncbi:MAG: agmatinase [Synergistota bacterium]|nr:agmatinase [Synergistota bacterium]